MAYHMSNPMLATSDNPIIAAKSLVDVLIADTYCITTWTAVGRAKLACLWEAPSEQAIIDAFARVQNILLASCATNADDSRNWG